MPEQLLNMLSGPLHLHRTVETGELSPGSWFLSDRAGFCRRFARYFRRCARFAESEARLTSLVAVTSLWTVFQAAASPVGYGVLTLPRSATSGTALDSLGRPCRAAPAPAPAPAAVCHHAQLPPPPPPPAARPLGSPPWVRPQGGGGGGGGGGRHGSVGTRRDMPPESSV